MPKHTVTSERLPRPSGHFAQAVATPASGRLVFISGMLAKGGDGELVGPGDITAQTRQVCENLKAAVEAAGGTLEDICRVDVFIRDMKHFPEIHAVRRQYFTGTPPASTMVEVVGFTHPDALIEINAIAVVA
jgi:reactive intermediate/imine deaminase